MMRLKEMRAIAAPMASKIANAYIDFSKMTTLVVGLKFDIEGREVIGYGFNSNGRYGALGLLNERFGPRLVEASKVDGGKKLVNDTSGLICPFKCWDALMTNEKPGGHGERSVVVGTLDMAIWDAVAKAQNAPLWKLLSEQYNGGAHDNSVAVYAAGGYYYPGKGLKGLQDEMLSYIDRGYTNVKMKIGGLPTPGVCAARAGGQTVPEGALELDESRIRAVLDVLPPGSKLAVDANGRFDLQTAIRYGKMLQPFSDKIMWYEEAGDPLDYQLQADLSSKMDEIGSTIPMATGENLFS
eukprot:Hpha_TRINITY_DN5780_c0_g1::TRINITY_DN5780_c0_g1_i1::g.147511::m.147511